MFDGPLDMDWVENFNTLLDKNQVPIIVSFTYLLPTNLLQVLCFESGECQALSSGVRVVFESTSLANISPATVSRCAVVSLFGIWDITVTNKSNFTINMQQQQQPPSLHCQ